MLNGQLPFIYWCPHPTHTKKPWNSVKSQIQWIDFLCLRSLLFKWYMILCYSLELLHSCLLQLRGEHSWYTQNLCIITQHTSLWCLVRNSKHTTVLRVVKLKRSKERKLYQYKNFTVVCVWACKFFPLVRVKIIGGK